LEVGSIGLPVVACHAGVVSPKCRQIPTEQMPLRVHGRDEERELIGAAFDDVAHFDLCAIVKDLLDVC
jgi:hypothetical protein